MMRRMQKIVVSPCAERTLRHEDLGCRLASRCLSLCVMFISTLTVDRQLPFVYVLSILTSNARLQFISPSSAWLQLAPSNVGFPFPARVRGEAGEDMLGRLLQAAPEGVRVGQLLPEIVSVCQHRQRCHLLASQFFPKMVISWNKVDKMQRIQILNVNDLLAYVYWVLDLVIITADTMNRNTSLPIFPVHCSTPTQATPQQLPDLL